MKATRLFVVVCLACMMSAAIGCGGLSSSTSSSTRTPKVSGNPNPPGTTPSPTFLYVANMASVVSPGAGSISAYSIDSSTGALKSVNGSPFSGDASPAAIASDPGGHFVFVAEGTRSIGARGGNCLDFHSLLLSERVDGSSGMLTLADRKMLDGSCASSVAVDPSGTHVYVGMEGFEGATTGEIQVFTISASGTLTEIAGSPFQVDGFTLGFAFHPNGKFVYGASTSGVQVFNRDANSGALTQRGVFNGAKFDVALNPAGTFLVATDTQNNRVAAFNVDQNTGDIAATEQFPPASIPVGVAADPLGSYFAVSETTDQNTGAGGVSTFLLSTAGGTQLVKTTGSPFGPASRPGAVIFDPTGKFVYVTNFSDSGGISGYTLDRSSGKLTPFSGPPVPSPPFPSSITVVKPH